MTRLYRLDEKNNAIECSSYTEFNDWKKKHKDNHVASEYATYGEKVYWVSTVFLAIDHSFGGETPILFETMVFPVKCGDADYGSEVYCRRYSTWVEAELGHKETVASLQAGSLEMRATVKEGDE